MVKAHIAVYSRHIYTLKKQEFYIKHKIKGYKIIRLTQCIVGAEEEAYITDTHGCFFILYGEKMLIFTEGKHDM